MGERRRAPATDDARIERLLSRRAFIGVAGLAGARLGVLGLGPIAAPLRGASSLRGSDYRTLSAALAAARGRSAILRLDRGARMVTDRDVEIPDYVALVAEGGIIEVRGHHVGIAGAFQAPADIRVFDVRNGGAVAFRAPATVTPVHFGAVPDGVTPAAAAIQGAQDAIGAAGGTLLWPAGAYLCETSLFLYGTVSWIAGTTRAAELLVCDWETRPGANFLAVGVTRTVRSGVRWSGACRGLQFRPAPALKRETRVNLVNVFDASDYEFSGNTFTGFHHKETIIKGANDSAWVDASRNDRANGRYIGNTIACAQGASGGEGISISPVGARRGTVVYARDMRIEGNVIEGVGDDPIALHGVDRVSVVGNRCRTVEGRVLVRNTEHFRVENNTLEHSSRGGGVALLDLGVEGSLAATRRRSAHGVIAGNTLKIRAGQDIAQAMFLQGAHDVLVTRNEVVNESDHVTRIRMVAHRFGGDVYPYGRVTVRENRLIGCTLDAAGGEAAQDDWVVLGPNTIDGRGRFDMLVRSSAALPGTRVLLAGVANPRPGSENVVRIRGPVEDAVLLDTWSADAVREGGQELLRGDGTRELPLAGSGVLVVTELRAQTTPAVAGAFRVQLMENGVPRHTQQVRPGAGALPATAGVTGRELSRRGFPAGRRLGVRVIDADARIAGRPVSVAVFGVWIPSVSR